MWGAVLATRPKTLVAALVPLLVGSALAGGAERHWGVVAAAAPAFVLIQIGTNLVNDASDYERGADAEDRLGDLRVTQAGVFTPRAVHRAGVACFAAALLCCACAVAERGAKLLGILALSCVAGYGYTAGPLPLAYAGLGDVTVVAFFGVVATGVVRVMHAGWPLLRPGTVVAGTQCGCLCAELLAINNIRDVRTDARVAKRTLPVRFGLRFARGEVAALAATAYALSAFWWRRGALRAAALPLATAPFAAVLVRLVYVTAPSAEYNRLLGRFAMLHAAFGVLLAMGLEMDAHLGPV